MTPSWRDGGIQIVVLPFHPNDTKEFHLYDREALKNELLRADDHIDIFLDEIKKLEERKMLLRQQISECDERDRAIELWDKEIKLARKRHGDAAVDEALRQQKEALRNGNAGVSPGRPDDSVHTG